MHKLRNCALIGVLLILVVLSFASDAAAGTALAGKSVGISPGHGREWAGTGWVWERGGGSCAPLTDEDLHNVDLAIYLNAYLAQDGAVVKAYRCLDKNYGNCSLTGLPWWQMSASYWLQNMGYPASVYASGYTYVDDNHDTILGSGSTSEYWDTVDSRALASNYDNTDILVGLHTNAFNGTATGTEIYYEGTQTIHQAWWDSSRALATSVYSNVLDSIRNKYGDASWSDRGVKNANNAYHETQIANRPAVLLELAFHDNCTRDGLYLQDDFFRSTTMWAVYKGVCNYFGVTPTYDYYSCDLVSSDIPAKIVAGQTVPVHLTFRNHGVVWSAARGFRLDALVTPDPFTTQTSQSFAGEVNPNDTITFTFNLTAPNVLGPYQTGWMMAREGYAWFGPSVQQVVQVVDASDDETPPSVPTNLTASAASFNRINLSWSPSTDNFSIAGYKIFRNGSFVGSTIGTSYGDAGLLPSTTYMYRVLAYDGSGNLSAQSDPASATTLADGTPPAAPTNVSAVGTTISRMTITWTAAWDNTAVTSYKVFRNGIQIGTATTTAFADSGLAAGTNYAYQVSALDAAGNESSRSASATGRTLGLGDQVTWSTNMESYTSQADFSADWPSFPGYSALTWSTAKASSPTHSGEESNSATQGSYHAFTPAQSQISVGTFLEFKFYDPAAATSVKHWGTIRGYSGGGYNNGSILELLTIGCNTGQGCSGTRYNGRSTNGVGGANSGWFDLNVSRSAGWHTMRIDVVGDTTNTLYPGKGLATWSVDGVIGAENPISWQTFTCCTIGSANASTNSGSYYYDDVKYGVQGTIQRTGGPDVALAAPTSVVISWKTDVASSSRVDYGATSGYGAYVSNSSSVQTHAITLTGLTPGAVYHFKVTSTVSGKNNSVSEDFMFRTPAASLSQLKSLADGVTSSAYALVVSAVLSNGFYVQDENRVSGIKVLGTQSAAVGSRVNVFGTLGTDNGERVLQDAIVTPAGSGDLPRPLGLNNKAVGGALTGANNTSLLVTAWGRVTEVGNGVFWIDDGSARGAAGGKTGVKVAADGLLMPSKDDVVTVTGISGAETVSGSTYSVLRPRSDSDIVKLSHSTE